MKLKSIQALEPLENGGLNEITGAWNALENTIKEDIKQDDLDLSQII
ncbi:hypothetical protein [Flammeovirga aprica]|uniref:Uncharacterized protein n=1 Tax=Flammeovirga aprica JL-4 TaxID=694437 RepID=A0A7X9S2B1_9BACT|nr:hypothetical protein [Flammeovirga aprica]NME72877.1 hypothetical protein [Flammeovirga aprica JL-4]